VDPLDNIMWYSMEGPHFHLAEGGEHARRFPSDVGPFSAVPDEALPKHFEALRELIGPGGVGTLFRGEVSIPTGWEVLGMIDGVQMTWPSRPPPVDVDRRIVALGDADVDEMMSLTSRTKPGPFARRTVELGMYLGIRLEGELIAMSGQRARTDTHVEISAVCTDDRYVGRGLGRALVHAQVRVILDEGMTPMLHTSAHNARAIALYEYLGFEHRRRVSGAILRSPN
jgi:GNAT superfamily N-acetyltransferase